MNLSFRLIAGNLGHDLQAEPYIALRRVVNEEPALLEVPHAALVEYKFFRHGFALTYHRNFKAFYVTDLFTIEFQQFSKFEGVLPSGIILSDKKSEIYRKLGTPVDSGEVRRAIPVPEHPAPTDRDWKDYLERQRAQPLTRNWCVFNVDDYEMRLWFDDDLDGQMTCVTLTEARKKVGE